MKKWFALLLFIVTMAGSFIPCCMDDDCADELAQQADRSHDEHEDRGPCSPFFACGTCAVSIDVSVPGIEFTEAEPAVVQHQSFYLLRLGSYNASLFQPPRYFSHYNI